MYLVSWLTIKLCTQKTSQLTDKDNIYRNVIIVANASELININTCSTTAKAKVWTLFFRGKEYADF